MDDRQHRYHRGDRVIVREDLKKFEQYGSFTLTSSMADFRGRELTIRQWTGYSYKVEENTFYWEESMLRPACTDLPPDFQAPGDDELLSLLLV